MGTWGIKQRVLMLALLPTLIISILLGIYFTVTRLNDLTTVLHNRGEAITIRLASLGESGIFAHESNELRLLARNSLSNEVTSIAFFSTEGIEIASAGKLNSNISPPTDNQYKITIIDNSEDSISFLSPVTLPEIMLEDYAEGPQLQTDHEIRSSIIGWVKVELDKKTTRLKEYQVLIHSILIVLFGISISGLLALKIAMDVTEPILAMTQAIEKIKNGKLSTRIKTDAKWELDILKSGINTMVSSMQKAQRELQNNVEQATADLRQTLEQIEIQNIELQLARKEAENSSIIKSEFLSSISHELRTPLNAILGFINLLAKTETNATQKDYLNIIQKSSASLLSIINEVLDFSKIEAGKLKLENESMDIRECIEDTLTLLAPTAHEKNLELIPFIYNDVPEKIISDSLRIKQVLTNLVINAIRFTEQGNITVRVMLEESEANNIKLNISVTDTGIGLTDEQQKELFIAFNQVNPQLLKTYGGTGLGLVISKRIVEQMQGSIELHSEPGVGTTFYFTLQATRDLNASSSAPRLNTLSNTKILLIEKNPTTRLAMSHLLKSWGILVTEISCLADLREHFVYKQSNVKHYDMLFLGSENYTANNELFNETLNLAKKYNSLVGVMLNTTEHLIHTEFLKSGATLCIAKPIARNKLYTALCNIFTTQNDIANINDIDTNLHLLAVDDNLANLKLLKALAENIGTKITCATNGEEAIQLSMGQRFDLILMDINMPILDGMQTTRQIKLQAPLNADTPVVALSAHIQHTDEARLKKSGIVAYLNKPITEHDLKATIYKWTHKAVVKTQSTPHSVDWDLGLKLAANKEDLAKDMFEMLQASLPKDIQLINSAYSEKNFQNLREHVHKLHGTCCYCGVPYLKQITKDLELAIINPQAEKIKPGIEALNLEVKRVLQILSHDLQASA